MLTDFESTEFFLFLLLTPPACIYFLSVDTECDTLPMTGLDQSTAIAMFGLALVMAAISCGIYQMGNPRLPGAFGTARAQESSSKVPFILLSAMDEHDHQAMFRSVHKSLEVYRDETHRSLETLSRALDVARDHSNIAAHLIRSKIERLSALFHQDMETLHQILCMDQLQLIRVLPSSASEYGSLLVSPDISNERSRSRDFVWSLGSKGNGLSHIPYDSVRQVVAHVIRDWSDEGSSVRDPLYNWIVMQLQSQELPLNGPVLVPGAGMGRLAYEIAFHLGRAVEALESSITMATMADALLRTQRTHQYILHPYASDPFANEINSELRYASVSFPDTVPSLQELKGSLSFTLAEFSKDALPENHYAAVVTCFFIDTAATFFDYISTIEGLLVKGGLFINVGPLHWHPNSHVPLAADEIRSVLESRRNPDGQALFDLLVWTVDDRPLKYRDSRVGASTFNDGYLPIRFVFRKR